jgi:ATP-dependent exoDNAse (exonuclease V) beta subunit
VRAVAASLLRPEERAASSNPASVVAAAATIWTTVAAREDVVRLLESTEVMAEVPFSLRTDDDGRTILLRGTIDGVALAPDGRVTVVEFKTGQPRPFHEEQLALYVRAARELFPGRAVEGRLVYQDRP